MIVRFYRNNPEILVIDIVGVLFVCSVISLFFITAKERKMTIEELERTVTDYIGDTSRSKEDTLADLVRIRSIVTSSIDALEDDLDEEDEDEIEEESDWDEVDSDVEEDDEDEE